MTDQNNAAQPGENLLDYAMAIAHERELDVTGHRHDSEGAVRRFKAAVDRALLSKLRAEGVQSAATTAHIALPDVLPELTTPGGAQYVSMATMQTVLRAARAALASAPVAGEAVAWRVTHPRCPKPGWQDAAREPTPSHDEVKQQDPDLVLELAYAAPQASETVRILFPAHLRKMWSGGEVQAWLDDHQGITPPKASAKGCLERYRQWQAEQTHADKVGAGSKEHQ